ncbi:MAG: EAL domain-containing protein [Parerythrobacter sp.]
MLHDRRDAGMPDLAAALVAAMETDAFTLRFQPQYACIDNAIIGAESLVRWEHVRFGKVGGEALFAMARRVGLAGALAQHTRRAALRHAASWPDTLRLSVNITAHDLANDSFATAILRDLDECGFAADRLTLEITEQAELSALHRTAVRLRVLAEEGIAIALDDFGTGFCNFNYLKTLPLDLLKLDRSMVEGIADDAQDLAVFRAILAMADALGLDVMAEGVETEAQRTVVAREACSGWQGFLGAKPVDAAQFAQMVG